MIKIGTKEVKNLPSELTIAEFENISRLLQDESISPIETSKEVLQLAGADLDELHEMTLGQLKDVWLEWNKETDIEKGLKKSIEINGYEYQAYKDENFVLNSRDLGMIQGIVNKRKKDSNFWHLIIAVIFKRTDLTKAEHYDIEHIKHKAKLILENKISSELAIPYIALITQEMAEFARETLHTKNEEFENAKELEGNNG